MKFNIINSNCLVVRGLGVHWLCLFIRPETIFPLYGVSDIHNTSIYEFKNTMLFAPPDDGDNTK